MKPIKLEIEGLNSFESKQVVDFDAVASGVFGIFGKTGSGKSTILDAITLALYGEVERSKQNIDFINTKRRKTFVSLEFEIFYCSENRHFLVCRSFSIKKNGKDVESSANLYELIGDERKLICEGAIKVNDKIFEIVGLGKNEFVKCIALPQGEFSAFLKARQSERTEILSNIFDLSRYGDELCAKVKEKVNEFDKQVATLTASLSVVDYATDERLSEAKQNYEYYKNTYSEQKTDLDEKTKLYTKLSLSLERKKKLEEINHTYSELMLKKQEIEDLENEISKNQGANSIKSDYEKLVKSKNDENELSQKIGELEQKRIEASKEYETVQTQFEEFKNQYDGKLLSLNNKLSKLSELMQFEDEQNSLKKEQDEIKENIALERKNLELEQEKLGFVAGKLEKIEQDIEKIEDFIEANKSDVDLSNALEQTKGIESEIILIEELIKSIESVFDDTNEQFTIAQEEYDNAIKQEKKLTEKIDQIQNSINVAFEDIDKTNFNKIRSCDKQLELMKETNYRLSFIDSSLSKLIYDKESRQATISSINDEIEKTQNELNNIENTIENREIFIKNERERREELLGSNFFSLVSNQMKIGDDCPICGSRVIQKNYEEVFDINPITMEIASEEENLRNLRKQRDKLFADLTTLRARNNFERNIVEVDKQEIDALAKEEHMHYTEYVEDNDHSKENFNKLYKLLSETSDKLEKLIDLQDMLREELLNSTIKKTQTGTKISIFKTYIEKINDILYDLQKKKAERELAIFNVNEKYKNLKEYKKQIAEGKNIELVIDSKKEEKYELKDKQTKLLIEKSKLESNISEINTKIAVLNEKLAVSQQKFAEISEKISENGIPDGRTVSDESKLVSEEIEELKLDYGKKEMQVESCKELYNRTKNDYTVSSTILNSKREEIDTLQSHINFAMSQNHFNDSLEMESYFASQAEIKEKQAKVNDYKSQLQTVEGQRRELEVETIENVSEEKVQQLKLDLDLLMASIQELSEQVGRQSAEFDKLSADNKKRKEISGELKYVTHKLDLAKELSSVLKGKALAEYVAEEYLQEITIGANQKLNLLLDGKYNLKFLNKEFVVEDNFNDGQIRSASTLSGGETFLVSLSLAFAISDAISMMSERSMNFFFLDEGFGTLDSELCEIVVSALHKLESQNLNIGLISHVSELEESIKNKIYVTKTSTGSKISIEHTL